MKRNKILGVIALIAITGFLWISCDSGGGSTGGGGGGGSGAEEDQKSTSISGKGSGGQKVVSAPSTTFDQNLPVDFTCEVDDVNGPALTVKVNPLTGAGAETIIKWYKANITAPSKGAMITRVYDDTDAASQLLGGVDDAGLVAGKVESTYYLTPADTAEKGNFYIWAEVVYKKDGNASKTVKSEKTKVWVGTAAKITDPSEVAAAVALAQDALAEDEDFLIMVDTAAAITAVFEILDEDHGGDYPDSDGVLTVSFPPDEEIEYGVKVARSNVVIQGLNLANDSLSDTSSANMAALVSGTAWAGVVIGNSPNSAEPIFDNITLKDCNIRYVGAAQAGQTIVGLYAGRDVGTVTLDGVTIYVENTGDSDSDALCVDITGNAIFKNVDFTCVDGRVALFEVPLGGIGITVAVNDDLALPASSFKRFDTNLTPGELFTDAGMVVSFNVNYDRVNIGSTPINTGFGTAGGGYENLDSKYKAIVDLLAQYIYAEDADETSIQIKDNNDGSDILRERYIFEDGVIIATGGSRWLNVATWTNH